MTSEQHTRQLAAEGEAPKRQVYVRCNGRALVTTVDEIVAFFGEVGKPTSILNKNGVAPADGKIATTALVTFKKDKAFEKALALSGQQLGGREVVVGKNMRNPKKASGPEGSVRVFVGNLPFDATEEEVRALFDGVGTILFVRFAKDEETGGGKGFCHVIFGDEGEPREVERRAIGRTNKTLRDRTVLVGAAVAKVPKRKKAPRPHHSAKDGEEPAAKALKPSDWRHDKAAGLTLPRSHRAPPGTHDAWDGDDKKSWGGQGDKSW